MKPEEKFEALKKKLEEQGHDEETITIAKWAYAVGWAWGELEEKKKHVEVEKMRYFELQEPYYAMLKAENAEEAVNKYIEVVSEDSPDEPLINEIKEVSRDYALASYARSTDEAGNLCDFDETMKHFQEEKSDILTIGSNSL